MPLIDIVFSSFQYSLKHSPDDNQFFIDDISGTIRIKKRLDFESKQLYNLTVKATDEGSPPLTSFASVLIGKLNFYFKITVFKFTRNKQRKIAKAHTVHFQT